MNIQFSVRTWAQKIWSVGEFEAIFQLQYSKKHFVFIGRLHLYISKATDIMRYQMVMNRFDVVSIDSSIMKHLASYLKTTLSA